MDIEALITKWHGTPGGAERANFPIFINDFCRALGLPEPEMATGGALSDYQYEAPVRPDAAFSVRASGRIDLYRRGSFVLEAKQSRLGDATAPPPPAPAATKVTTTNLFGETVTLAGPAVAARLPRRYDRLMEDALAQAKGYALALPPEHGWPPFLIVCDVGRAFEVYFDWAGNGKGYGFFPDAASYRIELTDLRLPQKAQLLRDIWLKPASVDPRLRAAEVTRDIAGRLARVSAYLEAQEKKANPDVADWQRSRGIEETSLFLMRILFCMFAEDVELLPKGKFEKFLADAVNGSERMWTHGLTELWTLMGKPGITDRWWQLADTVVRYFNGNLFTDFRIYWLPPEMKAELLAAARREWKNVEPAIFGTLLEQALTAGEREKLGAHYTPRPYVERLVEWTIMDVLRTEWAEISSPLPLPSPLPSGEGPGVGPSSPSLSSTNKEPTPDPSPGGGEKPSLAAATAFHARLAGLRILDPACGTGNFLYVAMEQLLRLESEVIVLINQLGGAAKPAIGPGQFLGLELNPRAATIAELVLWIGWLRFRLANDPDSIAEPVLPPLSNINFGQHGGYDAVLAGNPATGETADLTNPRPAPWPEADFIVGNPPFIGGQDLRQKLGDDYAEGLWKANPAVPPSADLVMQWWDRAAALLTLPGTRLRRFGFVTTNSITQTFSRRVVDARLAGTPPISLVMAIADHPWIKQLKQPNGAPRRKSKDEKGPAAVRIAMTVGEAGTCDGHFIKVLSEAALDTDEPKIATATTAGRINADLTLGADVTSAIKLKANAGICHDGVKLHGQGFSVTRTNAEMLGIGRREGLDAYIRPYRNGRDLAQRTPLEVADKFVIDLFGLREAEVRLRFPEVWQHLRSTVWPERNNNRRATYRDNWWIFGEPRRDMRPSMVGLTRYIATVDTAKHRTFQFLPAAVICDDGVIKIASDEAYVLGILSSMSHTAWALAAGGSLGATPRYFKSMCFDPFPFPDATPEQRAAIAEIAEEIDATRKTVQAEHPDITLTGLYNLIEKLRAGTALPEADTARRARAAILLDRHRALDAAVAAAYGWPTDLAPAEIVARLVALNATRAAEEAAGTIRWLRPDYQAKR